MVIRLPSQYRLLLVFFTLPTLLVSQSAFEVLSETELSVDPNRLPGAYLGQQQGLLYFLNVEEIPYYKPTYLKSEHLRLLTLDPKTSRIGIQELDFGSEEGIYLQRAYSFDNRAFLSARFPEGNESGSIRAEVELNLATGAILDTIEILETIEDRNGKKYGYEPYPDHVRTGQYQSLSGGVAMTYLTQQAAGSKEPMRIYIGGFNAVRGEIIRADFRINHPFRSVVIEQALVNEDGTSFFLVKLYEKNKIEVVKENGEFQQGYKTYLYRVDPYGEVERTLVFDGKALSRDHFMQFDWEGDLMYVNTHYPDREYLELTSIQFSRIDATSLEVILTEKQRFTSEMFPNETRSKYTGKTNSIASQATLVNLVPTKDGDAYLVFGTDLQLSASTPGGREIEIVFIHRSGKIEWVKIAPGPWYSAVNTQQLVVDNDLWILLCGPDERFKESPDESGLTKGFNPLQQVGALWVEPDGDMGLETILEPELGVTDFRRLHYLGNGHWSILTQQNYESVPRYFLATFRIK